MQKLLNDPTSFADETIEGILLAHPDELRRVGSRSLVRAVSPLADKVAIVTGGGSGHLPLFLGYVGDGLADGVAVGNVFASPSAEEILEVTRAVHGNRGVLHLFGNYGGDVMNFGLAAELAADEGIDVKTVLGADDVASAPKGDESRRRGVAGIAFLYKIAGAKAAQGAALHEVVAVTRSAAMRIRSIGVGLAPCVIPAAGTPTFQLEAGEMEIGIGIHGEPGVRRGSLERADDVAKEMTDALIDDLDIRRGDAVAVLVNGLGATPREELYILYRGVNKGLLQAGVQPERVRVGEFATSLEMAGASVSLLVLDDELRGLLDSPARSPLFVQP